MLVVLAFSDEFLGAFNDELKLNHRWDWLLVPIDFVILSAVLLAKRLFRWRTGGAKRRSILIWWLVGALMTLGLDFLTAVLVTPRTSAAEMTRLWLDLAVSPAYIAALAIILSTTLNASPTVFLSQKVRNDNPDEWVRVRTAIPLLIGTLFAYLATTWWEYQLDGDVDQEFFAQMSQVIVLLIVALGVEVGFFRDAATDPGQRPTVVFAVFILSLGEVMALSALVPLPEAVPGWHAYAAFVIVIEASLVALATMLWVLLDRTPRPTEPPPGKVVIIEPPKTTGKSDPVALVGLGFGIAVVVALALGRRKKN